MISPYAEVARRSRHKEVAPEPPRAADSLARHRSYERALAGCSNALLLNPDGTAIDTALVALLAATDADYAYVEENFIGPELQLCFRIIDEAAAPVTSSAGGDWYEGLHSDTPTAYTALAAGEPAIIKVGELPHKERLLYEQDGILSELLIPIYVEGEWVGSIGFSDYLHERDWDRGEIIVLTTAAEMIGAFWQRQGYLKKLQAMIRSKDAFIATISHELRTPLTSVIGFADLLVEHATGSQGLDPAEQSELLTLIWNSANEASWIIEDLLASARGDLGTLALAPARLDVGSEIRQVVAVFERSTGLSVITPSDSSMVVADSARLRQIVRNLLQNAQRYGGPLITIEMTREDGWVVVEVIDDGDGLPLEQWESIFEPYRTVHETPTPGAVGLGLAISRRLAEMMGCTLTYLHDGEHSRFRLRIPASTTEPTEHRRRNPAG